MPWAWLKKKKRNPTKTVLLPQASRGGLSQATVSAPCHLSTSSCYPMCLLCRVLLSSVYVVPQTDTLFFEIKNLGWPFFVCFPINCSQEMPDERMGNQMNAHEHEFWTQI